MSNFKVLISYISIRKERNSTRKQKPTKFLLFIIIALQSSREFPTDRTGHLNFLWSSSKAS